MAKTLIIPKDLYENRNTSDVFSRLIVMGVLRILNQLLKYTLIWDDTSDGIQNITVPFFFDFSGGSGSSEKFIQDNYLHWTDTECTTMGIKKIDGDFKPLPYGVITLDSTQIESGNISNRFVMGLYQRKEGTEMKSYVSFLYSIPLTYSFTVNVGCDTVNTMWKIEQAFREYFYKNKTFRFNYKGTVCSARVGFPESLTETKTNTYTLGAQTVDGTPDIKLSFSLSVETYQPVFDPFSEQPADQTINSFKSNIIIQDAKDSSFVKYSGKEIGDIVVNTDLTDKSFTTEQDIFLSWNFNYNRSDLLAVDIVYQDEDDSPYTVIDTVENHNCYHLVIDDEFVDNPVLLDLIIKNNDECLMVNQPKLKFYIDPETNIIDESHIVVIDKGFIITGKEQIDAIISYENNKGKYIEKEVKLNILNNALDEAHPVEKFSIVYSKTYNYKKIKLFIRDHYNPEIIQPCQSEDSWIKIF